ncbi:MAG: sugar transferase [Paracoccaceae bacterium]
MSDTHHFASVLPRAVASGEPQSIITYSGIGKRLLDICLAVALLPVLVPVILVLIGIVRLDGGAGLYGHTRIGRHGKPFACLKVRTMVMNAEAMLSTHLSANPDAAREWGRSFKLIDDPRITRVGRILRRTGLDELPQIWNVLIGQMSLVGPRPVTEPELAMYGPNKSAYLSVRPGVTGMWQVHGRMTGCYKNRVQLDRGYLDAISLKSDIKLISQTALSVIRMTGC